MSCIRLRIFTGDSFLLDFLFQAFCCCILEVAARSLSPTVVVQTPTALSFPQALLAPSLIVTAARGKSQAQSLIVATFWRAPL